MSGVSEFYIERKVSKYAASKGWLCRKMKWIGRRSAPDHYFSKSGHTPFMVEFKKTGEKPRKAQEREIARLRKHGTIVHVIDNVEDGLALFA